MIINWLLQDKPPSLGYTLVVLSGSHPKRENDLTSLATAWRALSLGGVVVSFSSVFCILLSVAWGNMHLCKVWPFFLFVFVLIHVEANKNTFLPVSNCFPFSFVHSACFCFPVHVMLSAAPPATSSYFSFPLTPSSNCFPLFPPLHCFVPIPPSELEILWVNSFFLSALHSTCTFLNICIFLSPNLLFFFQGVGGDHRWGTEHADPSQRGSSSPALRKRADGHMLQRPLHCCLGHGIANRHQLTSRPCGTPRCCQRGGLWWQIYSVCLRGPYYQSEQMKGFSWEIVDILWKCEQLVFYSYIVFMS